jgi:hypothetical protein
VRGTHRTTGKFLYTSVFTSSDGRQKNKIFQLNCSKHCPDRISALEFFMKNILILDVYVLVCKPLMTHGVCMLKLAKNAFISAYMTEVLGY